MESNVVAFVRDQALLARCLAEYDGLLPGTPQVESTPGAVCLALKSAKVPLLLLDARLSQCDAETEILVSRLMTEFDALNVIVLSDGVYPLQLAAPLHLLASETILVSPQGLSYSDPGVRRVMTAGRANPVPKLRQVASDDVHLASYSPEIAPMLNDLLRVAHRDVTLLIVGETGTGKTTLARFIHQRSSRRDKPFQHLACGTLPGDLIESELFGHIRGAFTGADRNKVGRFQAAGSGTLLLDEIDVLDLRQQSKLLKVIETGEYELVGSTETRISEARLIVASNVELEELTEKGQFRSDLYYRLNVLEFRLPPLRRRQLDIVPLTIEFVQEACRQHGVAIQGVHRDFLDAVRRYRWPGNLRELKNQIRRSVLFCETGVLGINDLSPKLVQAQFADPDEGRETSRPAWTLADRVALSERELLEQALRENNDNRTRTAKALGLSRVGLYKKLRRLGLMDQPKESANARS